MEGEVGDLANGEGSLYATVFDFSTVIYGYAFGDGFDFGMCREDLSLFLVGLEPCGCSNRNI
jgi:hypothetical protein